MRMLASLAVTSTLLAAGGASAGQQIVPIIDSATAGYSTTHTIVIRVTAELPSTCWSNPQLRLQTAQARPKGGIVGFAVVANLKTGVMCAMHVTKVSLPRYNWRTYPNGVRGVQVAGSSQPVTAMIQRTGG